MKIKIDFVTNSSSASFIILKHNLTDIQIEMIKDHINIGLIIGKRQGLTVYPEPWHINETEDSIMGDTNMDNFSMLWFLHAIGVKREYIEYDHSG
jgi:hypothetical protein